MERCPFCGWQLISCSCVFKKLGYAYKEKTWDEETKSLRGHPTCGLPKDVYEKGLPPKQEKKWHKILEKKGRIPYIVYPLLCSRCGEHWPDFFMVPDDVWEHYVEPMERDSIICMPCFREIVTLIDGDPDVLALLNDKAILHFHG